MSASGAVSSSQWHALIHTCTCTQAHGFSVASLVQVMMSLRKMRLVTKACPILLALFCLKVKQERKLDKEDVGNMTVLVSTARRGSSK